jgi:succinate dehydrogenase / fumarate reductase, iron-sulfur subunit
MQVTFKILRQSLPSDQNLQEYILEVETGKTILDCLNQIKWELDGSLAFRQLCNKN